MREQTSSRLPRLAALLLITPTLALPQGNVVGSTVADAPIPWITVNPSGVAETHSPQVITTEGHRTTISQPPSALVSTATYTISPNGRASTYTGLAPIASATGSSGEGGAFLACANTVGVDEPFCLPRRGSTLLTGGTYYITWAPSYFPSSEFVNLQISLADQYNANASMGSIVATPLLSASGYYPLHVPDNFLESIEGSPSSTTITLSLAYAENDTPDPNDVVTVVGPTVYIARRPADSVQKSSGGGGVNVIAIAVPVIIVVLLLAFIGYCFVKWRKTGSVPFVGAVMKRRSTGYGVGKSRSQRVGRVDNSVAQPGDRGPYTGGAGLDKETAVEGGAVELTDRDSWGSPTSSKGRNLFREEVERQEREAAASGKK
ncbi:hypothetical protein QBC43DRAFT_309783 [Cladorrhinum sp. PSN259]|nr:hypothetical protein QBC43DRAFT_309783 [Cladorrhinum sp. PSN259]